MEWNIQKYKKICILSERNLQNSFFWLKKKLAQNRRRCPEIMSQTKARTKGGKFRIPIFWGCIFSLDSSSMKRNSKRKSSTSVPMLCCNANLPTLTFEWNISRENFRVISVPSDLLCKCSSCLFPLSCSRNISLETFHSFRGAKESEVGSPRKWRRGTPWTKFAAERTFPKHRTKAKVTDMPEYDSNRCNSKPAKFKQNFKTIFSLPCGNKIWTIRKKTASFLEISWKEADLN